MTVATWLRAAIADAEGRGLPELKPLLESLALETGALRAANLPHDTGGAPPAHRPDSTAAEDGGSVAPPRPAAAMMTIEEFGRKLRAGEVSAADMTDECLNRIDSDNARLNAFILVMADEARRQAREADEELAAGTDRGPLHGVPVSIKDLIDVRGTATTAASRVREGHRAERDAPLIAHLRQAGAVIVGKTNLHEFAFGTTNEDSAFGPARNPYDTTRSPGGSSGGSAASLVAGMALATVGTDTGGSIRIPAAACGTVGLKPSFGEVSVEGVVPLSPTLDHVGPLARTVRDAWYLYQALIGRRTLRPLTALPVGGLRLAVARGYFCDLLDDEVRARFDAGLDALRAAGARIDETDIPHAGLTAPIYLHVVLGDAAAYHATMLETMPERYTPPVRLRLEMARYVLAEDYVRAQAGREVLRREIDQALSGYDALILPTLPIPAPPLGAITVRLGSKEELVRSVMLRLTQLFNLTGQPAISLPCGRTTAGLPCGLQLVGTRMQTAPLVRAALAVEDVVGQDTPLMSPRGEDNPIWGF
jgi:aspartyl-tRNA(Asn)/glutamyl-tRNA(Gln) amidotransferase subunit A